MQQPLERYGVVVLLFLVALVAVAIFWEDGKSTGDAEQQLAAVTPEADRPVAPEAERSEDAERRPTRPEIELSREGAGEETRDKRGRTTTYGVTPRMPTREADPVAPGGDEVADADAPGFSRPEARGGRVDGGQGERLADELASGVVERDPLAAALEREAESERPLQPAAPIVDAPLQPAVQPANVPAPKVQPAAAGTREVVVKGGDSLWKIAQRELGNGNRWKDIASLNGLRESDKIVAGMKLKVPTAAATTKEAPKTAAPAPSAPAAKPEPKRAEEVPPAGPLPRDAALGRIASNTSARRYVVKAGDTLGQIAQRELGSARHAAAIQTLNGMRDTVVKTGTTLLLPEVGRPAAPSGASIAAVTPPAAGRAVPAGARRNAPASAAGSAKPRKESGVR